MYECMYEYVCVHVCMYDCMYVHTHTHTHAYTHVHTHAHTHAYTLVHTHVHTQGIASIKLFTVKFLSCGLAVGSGLPVGPEGADIYKFTGRVPFLVELFDFE